MVTTASLRSAEESIKHPGKARGPLPKQESKTQPTLYVFRHGETYYNRNKLFCGFYNSWLTPRGKKQARMLADKLKTTKINLGVTSKLTRCTMTLDIALRYHRRTRIEHDRRLRERNYGKLTGKSKVACSRRDPELCLKYRRSWDFPPPAELCLKYRRSWDFPPPGGESIKDVWDKRIRPFCKDLEKLMREEKINIAVSCTNNTMRLIRMYFEKLSIEEMLSLENPLGEDYAAYTIN